MTDDELAPRFDAIDRAIEQLARDVEKLVADVEALKERLLERDAKESIGG